MMVETSTNSLIACSSSSAPAESNLNVEQGRTRKRSMDDSPLRVKKPRYSWYLKLQSESSEHSEEDTESVYSVQGHETEVVQDTPDTDTKSEGGNSTDSEVLFDVEYEIADLSDDENPFLEDNSSSGTDDCVMAAASAAIAAAICDNSIEWLTDGEESDNSSVSVFDAEPNHTGFGTCIQCKSKNNNPMFRYCQKCFQERKNLFPPRPKGRRRKRRKAEKQLKEHETTTESSNLQKNLESSQDSGAGFSQDFTATFGIMMASTSTEEFKEIQQEKTASQDSGIGSQDILLYDNIMKNNEGTNKRKRSISTTETEEDEDVSSSKRIKSENSNGNVLQSDSISSSEVLKNEVSTKCNGNQTTQNKCAEVLKNNESIEVNGNKPLFKPVIVTNSKQTDNELPKNSLPEHKELCIICNNHTKNSIFLHANIGHMCCCYKCAIHTWATNKKCPVCNGKVKNIVKVFEC